MDMAWIPVFVLTLSQCIAPAGKTICKQQELTLEFQSQEDCELALTQLVALKERANDVIVDKKGSRCTISARRSQVYASLDELRDKYASAANWQAPDVAAAPPDFTQEAHQKRLASLATCDSTGGVAPCKIGDIIVEGATQKKLEVWRRDE